MKFASIIKSGILGMGLLSLAACHPDDAGVSGPAGNIPESFDYKTTRHVSLNLSAFTPKGVAMKGADIIISSQPVSESGKIADTLAHGAIDPFGKMNVTLQVPTSVQTIYAIPRFPGMLKELALTVGQGVEISGSLVPEKVSNKRVAPTSNVANANGYRVLGGWDALGTPTNVMDPSDDVTPLFLHMINAILPEYASVPANPSRSYLVDGTHQTDLVLQDSTDMWVTFVSEGATKRNALGYYTYNKNNPPSSPNDITKIITKKTIVFPNCSVPDNNANQNGAMIAGDKVYIGKFPAGTAIGWFLVDNGYTVDAGNAGTTSVLNPGSPFYSNANWNPETPQAKKAHMVLMKHDPLERVVVGFEDVNRNNQNCDNDFNDLLFYVHLNPYIIENGADIANLVPVVDTDGDGVYDNAEEYPNDPDRAYNNYTPAPNVYGTLAFEDLWPAAGDYDMNDMVINYNYNTVTNASNKVVEMKAGYKVRALGASYNNGFGLQFDVAPNKVTSVVSSNQGARNGNETVRANNGTETAVTNKATVIVFNRASNFAPVYDQYLNTLMSNPKYAPKTLSLTVNFTRNSLNMSDLGALPFNPFIFVNHVRSTEVHLPGYAPTTLANQSLFSTMTDRTNLGLGRYYKSSTGMPFALHLPVEFQYPVEKAPITNAYLKFASWAQSAGSTNTDWYTGTSTAYRNTNYIYTK
ncbi:MAG: LruC domain-containing protein [Bacteroidota bacterium]